MKIVDVKNINYSYDGINKVLDNVNFYIEKAKIMTIVGPNGAGKSTLLKLLIGELSIQNGKINYFDEKGDIKPDKNEPEKERSIFIFENTEKLQKDIETLVKQGI